MKKVLIGVGIALVFIVIIFWGISAIGKAEIQNEMDRELMRELRLADCQQGSYDVYLADWNNACSASMLPSGCLLPMWRKTILDDTYQRALDRCVEMYK